jgi:hypothetical protein
VRRKQKQRGIGAPAAITLLAVCGVIAVVSLRPLFGGANLGGDSSVLGAFVDDTEPEPVDETEPPPGIDLLVQHGSWNPATSVRMAFATVVADAAAVLAAAPAGEVAGPANTQWIGVDPPSMHVGVVMVGDAVRRAVVDGLVVGLGDSIGRALIVAIERDYVVATWGGRRLTYDFDNEHPREFRAEMQRRGIDPNAAAKKAAADQLQEEPQ